MKKILYITAYPPNRKTAGQNYSRQLIEDLSKDYFINVIYWEYNDHIPEINAQNITLKGLKIKPFYNNLLLKLLIFPLFSKRFSWKTAFHIRKISCKYDFVYLDFSQVFIYGLFIKNKKKYGMSHDVILQKYTRTKIGRILHSWIKWSEKLMLRNIDKIFTFSQKDKRLIKINYNHESFVVPFYIENKIKEIRSKDLTIKNFYVMYGAWNRIENQESLLWVMDNLSDTVSLKIIGGGMPKDILSRLKKVPNMAYLGFLENPYPIIAESKALIAPLFNGAGVKVKAIEALALGTPVIGTEITMEGLPKMKTNAIYLVEDKDSLNKAIDSCANIDTKIKIDIQKDFFNKYISRTFRSYL